MMKKICILLCILWGLSHSYAQQTLNGFSLPESVVSNGKLYFVSNQGQTVFDKDGDGFISKVTADGTIVSLKFLPENGVLNGPKGMAIIDDILYVADLGRVVGFSLKTRDKVFELKIPETRSLNDVCVMDEASIAVTDPVSGNIYKVNTRTKDYQIIGNIPSVNGIAYNNTTHQLAVCTIGKPWGQGAVYIKNADNPFHKLPNMSKGFFDGIEWMDNQHLMISDWVMIPTKGFGKLWVYDLKKQQSQMFLTKESIADIHYEPSTQKIFMPQMFHNKVMITPLNKLKKSNHKSYNQLYQYGVANAFVGGLYKGSLELGRLLQKGSFGLGAPNMLDGELTILNGIPYQTRATGKTLIPDIDFTTSLAFVTFFKPDTVFVIDQSIKEKRLRQRLKSALKNKNGMYAIKISGRFDFIRTRAFPPVKQNPFPKLTSIMNRQHFFEFSQTEGTLVGFYMPQYVNGINISGFHFHFLSTDKEQGGHVLEFTGRQLKIEIAELKNFKLEIPKTKTFRNFDFEETQNKALEKVEQGK